MATTEIVAETGNSRVVVSDGATLGVGAKVSSGSAVVLVHGFTLDHRCWDLVTDRLVAAGLSVFTVDLRGHGASSLGSSQPDLGRLVEDLREVVVALRLNGVIVVGHSLGAFVALAARADPVLSQSLGGVIAISGIATSIPNPLLKFGARVFASNVGAQLVRNPRIGRSMLRSWFRRGASSSEVDVVRAWSAECPVETRRAIGGATTHIDLRPTFDTPGPPTLLVCGTEDRATPSRHSRAIEQAIVDADLALIEDAGHMVITEQPDALTATLVHWIATRPR